MEHVAFETFTALTAKRHAALTPACPLSRTAVWLAWSIAANALKTSLHF
jgi:hypothetical protein